MFLRLHDNRLIQVEHIVQIEPPEHSTRFYGYTLYLSDGRTISLDDEDAKHVMRSIEIYSAPSEV